MEFLTVKPRVKIPMTDIDLSAIRAQGPGGQNVNKVSSAIHLRFDVRGASTLLGGHKDRILAYSDKRISKDGVIVIKAQNHRTQERNKAEALDRLSALLRDALYVEPKRRVTRASYSSVQRNKKKNENRKEVKALRGKVRPKDL